MFYFFFFSIGMCRLDLLLMHDIIMPRRVMIRPRARSVVQTLQLSRFILSLVANAGAGDFEGPNALPAAKALTPLLTN